MKIIYFLVISCEKFCDNKKDRILSVCAGRGGRVPGAQQLSGAAAAEGVRGARPMEGGDWRVVHFVVGAGPRARRETAAFSADVPADELKDLFRAAAEAGPLDILKLYGPGGRLLNISPRLSPNSVDRPYRLEVVAAHCQGMLLDEVGVDLRALEERVARLEAQLRGDVGELPPAVRLLQQQVERFRTKLETAEHLSWMGFYKDMPPPLSTESCKRLQYRRKSDSMKKKVREKFFSICDAAVSEEVRQRLRQPTFDSCQWEDEELLLLLQQMFIDLDLPTKFGIEMPVLRAFLYEVYKNYNDVPFHNFRHSFCVAQMMYSIVCAVELPEKVGDLEILILLTSCICHDLDHPGYNNIYQINAKTELALRYNDISPLENHHCSVAFRVLENADCNIFRTLPSEVFRQVREGMIRCILATDMARHNEILAQFKELTPEFDFDNKAHVNLLSMVLIKVADISNEARPMEVAEPWLDRLLQEFFKQSDAEKLEGLPVTPFMDRDKVTKPSSQCSFIGLVLLPLFEALGELFQVLVPLIVQPVRDALDYYRRLNERTHHRKSVIDVGSAGGDSMGSLAKSGSAHSVKSRRSIASRSRSTDVEEGGGGVGLGAAGGGGGGGGGAGGAQAGDATATATVQEEEEEEADAEEEYGEGALPPGEDGEDDEDEDADEDETATEVEVSEKTLKFKIATESSIGGVGSGRRSGPGSRKGSRERTQPEFNQSDLARAMQLVKQRGSLPPTPPDTCNGGSAEAPPPPLLAQPSAPTPTPAPAPDAAAAAQGAGAGRSTSLLQRLRTLTERLPFGAADDAQHNCRAGAQADADAAEGDGRATTLPKVRKGVPASAHRRGWRVLIGGGGGAGAKGEAPSSSLELLSPSDASPTPATKRQIFSKRNSFPAGSLDSMLHAGAGAGEAGGARKAPGQGLLSHLGFSFRGRRARAGGAGAAAGAPADPPSAAAK